MGLLESLLGSSYQSPGGYPNPAHPDYAAMFASQQQNYYPTGAYFLSDEEKRIIDLYREKKRKREDYLFSRIMAL